MTWISLALVVLFLADALRLRARVTALRALAPTTAPVSPDHRFFVANGVTLDDATRRAASAHARIHGLAVLDLLPANLGARRLLGLVALVDPERYVGDRFGAGFTAGQAVLVAADVAARAGIDEAPSDPALFVRMVARLKRHACTGTGLAVAPDLHAAPEDPACRFAVLRERLGSLAGVVLVIQALLMALLGYGAFAAPRAGLVALALFHVQPILILAGQATKPRDLPWIVLSRAPLELLAVLGTWLGRASPAAGTDPVEARRAAYEELIRGGTDRFFEPRAERCIVCGGGDLVPHLHTTDLLQQKPGTFTLERCRGCDHVFQNPRLSLAGLDFYYRDFYDGLGEDGLEAIFGYSTEPYLSRARLLAGTARPRRWLDVGCGHGHFSCAARELFPEARFDGLDLSESVEEAARRGWIDQGHRGLFTDLAPRVAGAYDAVTMSHYLEHTLDPRAEIHAAALALSPGGTLLIEVPDPECVMGRVMGRWWLPWFQPQHLHLLSTRNLARILRDEGFHAVSFQRAEAHQQVDFFLAAMLLLGWIAPPPDQPWRPRRGALYRAWHRAVWTASMPLYLGARLADWALGPVLRRVASNTYRAVARRDAPGRTDAAPRSEPSTSNSLDLAPAMLVATRSAS